MPVLPLIDLLILAGWTSLMLGALLKAIDITTRYTPAVLGLSSIDFAVVAAICFAFALTLAARTWVKLNEPRLAELRRSQLEVAGRRRVQELEGTAGVAEPSREPEAVASVAERR